MAKPIPTVPLTAEKITEKTAVVVDTANVEAVDAVGTEKKKYVLTNKAGVRLGMFNAKAPMLAAKKAAKRGHVDIRLREIGRKYADGSKRIYVFEGSMTTKQVKPWFTDPKYGKFYDAQQKIIIPGSKTKENPVGLINIRVGFAKHIDTEVIPGKTTPMSKKEQIDMLKQKLDDLTSGKPITATVPRKPRKTKDVAVKPEAKTAEAIKKT